MPLDGGGGQVDVVVGDDRRLRDDGVGNARRGGNPERREPGAGLREERIGVAVIPARRT